jgi:CheY-like chemotaxis protein
MPCRLSDLRVLVVDDHATARTWTSEALTGLGASVGAAGMASEALAELVRASASDRPYHVAVIDACMDHDDGWALVELIRDTPEIAGTPVIMLAPADSALVGKNERYGLAHERILTKPVKYSDLAVAISNACERTGDKPNRRQEQADARPLKILLADDSAVNREVAVGLLELKGYQVVAVENGQEAVAACRENTFDVVLMDLEMPLMGGLEATAAIRTEESDGRRPVILAMTSHAFQEVRERCLTAGMDGYVTKPIQPSELFTKLQAVADAQPTPLEPQPV